MEIAVQNERNVIKIFNPTNLPLAFYSESGKKDSNKSKTSLKTKSKFHKIL